VICLIEGNKTFLVSGLGKNFCGISNIHNLINRRMKNQQHLAQTMDTLFQGVLFNVLEKLFF